VKNILRNIEEADNNIFATDPAVLLRLLLWHCSQWEKCQNKKGARTAGSGPYM